MRFSLAFELTKFITWRLLSKNRVQFFIKIEFIVFLCLFCFVCETSTKLGFFCINCSNSDNNRFVLFVFIKTLIFVMSLFMTFKAFDTTQIVRVTNLVDLFARHRQIFKDIELFVFSKLVDLI